MENALQSSNATTYDSDASFPDSWLNWSDDGDAENTFSIRLVVKHELVVFV